MLRHLCRVIAGIGACGLALAPTIARAAPWILVDAASGDVLEQQDATRSWFPASTTKLMTVYVALDAVAAGRLSLATPLVVSPRALSMAPSKMGFRAGTQVTLDNALKMLMVKSANDIAVTIAEGVSGSVENFAAEMNSTAARLGMRESHFVNPNGLPDAQHVSSARDLALLARALLQRFPDHGDLYDIGAMRLGGRIYPTHNGLLGRYPGADGMKTGFTCAAGFNIVATATRGNRRLIAVVLGAPSATARTAKAASMFDRGFGGRDASSGSVTALASYGVTDAPDMHDGVCRNRGKANAAYLAEIEDTSLPLVTEAATFPFLSNQPVRSFTAFGAASAPQQVTTAKAVAFLPRPVFTPIDVFVGPVEGWTGPVAHADDYAGPPSMPAATATAYAASLKAPESPLAPSADALPMRRGKIARARAKPPVKLAHAAAKAEPPVRENGVSTPSTQATGKPHAKPHDKPLKVAAKAAAKHPLAKAKHTKASEPEPAPAAAE